MRDGGLSGFWSASCVADSPKISLPVWLASHEAQGASQTEIESSSYRRSAACRRCVHRPRVPGQRSVSSMSDSFGAILRHYSEVRIERKDDLMRS